MVMFISNVLHCPSASMSLQEESYIKQILLQASIMLTNAPPPQMLPWLHTDQLWLLPQQVFLHQRHRCLVSGSPSINE